MALQNVEANITLDLYNHDTTPATVKAIQLDSQTRYVAAMLQSMGAEYGLDSGATVQLIVIRPDKVGVQITGTTFTYGDESSEYLGPYAELTQVALAVNGKMRGQFKITSGTQILRTEIFTISNGEALDASTDEWADEYDGYNLEEMATSIETNTADIASLEADVSQIKEDLSNTVIKPIPLTMSNGLINSQGVVGSNDGGYYKVSQAIDVSMASKIRIYNYYYGSSNGTVTVLGKTGNVVDFLLNPASGNDYVDFTIPDNGEVAYVQGTSSKTPTVVIYTSSDSIDRKISTMENTIEKEFSSYLIDDGANWRE